MIVDARVKEGRATRVPALRVELAVLVDPPAVRADARALALVAARDARVLAARENATVLDLAARSKCAVAGFSV
jgi:hypothetical protein